MTVEVKAEACHVAEEPVKAVAEEAEKAAVEEVECEKDEEPKPTIVEKSSSYREESNFLSDLKEHEKKALNDLKTKLEEAILGNTLFKKEEKAKEEEKPTAEEECEKEADNVVKCDEEEEETEKKTDDVVFAEPKPDDECAEVEEVDKDISIWGVPLLPSKGNDGTNVVLLKFLRAREFKVDDAFKMLEKTLHWRKEFKADSILAEELGTDLDSVAYMSGTDRQGHPICYNIFGVLDNEEIYEKTLATEEKREQFLRWRVQLMEKGVRAVDFKPDGVNSLVQVNDLKNSPGPSKKEVKAAVNKAIELLQDNYPEFVAKNVSFFSCVLFGFNHRACVSKLINC